MEKLPETPSSSRPPRAVIETLMRMVREGKLTPEAISAVEKLRDEKFPNRPTARDRAIAEACERNPGLTPEEADEGLRLAGF